MVKIRLRLIPADVLLCRLYTGATEGYGLGVYALGHRLDMLPCRGRLRPSSPAARLLVAYPVSPECRKGESGTLWSSYQPTGHHWERKNPRRKPASPRGEIRRWAHSPTNSNVYVGSMS